MRLKLEKELEKKLKNKPAMEVQKELEKMRM